MGLSDAIAKENSFYKVGWIISGIIIAGSLVSTIESPFFSISNDYALATLFLGLSIFAFFMGIRVNMRDYAVRDGDRTHHYEMLPRSYSDLSQFILLMSALFFLGFIVALLCELFNLI